MINQDELKAYKYDPNKIQYKIIEALGNSLDNEINITDPTNPFIFGLEANVMLTSNALEEMITNVRKLNPSLAKENEELFHHLTDDEYIDIFSTPSTGNIILFINLKDILNNGIHVDDSIKITIPRYTEITVDGYIFTLLNHIDITLYENKVYAEQIRSDNDINMNEIGILETNIVTDDSGVDWVILETLVKQVKRVVEEDTIIISTGVTKTFELSNDIEYFYSNVYYKNNNTNNRWVKIDKTHSDILYNRKDPIVKISYINKKLRFDISKTYLGTDKISGNIMFEVFTTKGKLDISLNRYNIEDFKIELGETGANEFTAVTPNLQFMAKSRTSVNGGTDGKTTAELKDSIINNTVRNNSIPITEYDLKEYGSKFGYDIYKIYDTVADRLFIASKKTSTRLPNNILSRIDTYNGTVKVELSMLLNHDTVIDDTDNIIIKSKTILKEDNGRLTILSKTDTDRLINLNKLELAEECLKNRYYFNPYYYIINKSNIDITSRIYDLDHPYLSNMRILNDIDSDIKVNISSYNIFKTDTGYKLLFKPVTGIYFDKLNKSLIKIQISLPIKDSTEAVKFTGRLDEQLGVFVVDIDTNFLIRTDNTINITNGFSSFNTKFVDLATEASLYIYTTDTLLIDNSKNKLNSELVDTGEVFIKENFSITFGNQIHYLWDKLHIEYTPRKYKVATEDIPLRYVEDVFEFYKNTNSIFNPTNFDETCQKYKDLEYKILHKKGDIVYDYNKIVYKYKKGDILRDDNNEPIIDLYSGVVRYVDMLVINYEYLACTNTSYTDYLSEHLLDTSKWITKDMEDINKLTLDNTIVKFKPYKGMNAIKILNNDKAIYLNHIITPKITLYVSKELTIDNNTRDKYKTMIGNILHTEIEKKEINITNIKKVIDDQLHIDIKGIKIERITEDELEAFNLTDASERLSLGRKLTLLPDNSTIVEYNIELEIIKI